MIARNIRSLEQYTYLAFILWSSSQCLWVGELFFSIFWVIQESLSRLWMASSCLNFEGSVHKTLGDMLCCVMRKMRLEDKPCLSTNRNFWSICPLCLKPQKWTILISNKLLAANNFDCCIILWTISLKHWHPQSFPTKI